MRVFTIELVVDHVKGAWRPRSSERPGLALKLLDLAPQVVEAPCLEELHGLGKALVFELPEALLQQVIPLWIMLLSLQPSADSARTGALAASAGLDMRQEVAAAVQREALSAPSPTFRRCSFGMTGVHASMPALQLSCYLRVYCGRHQPTGELMLEPILWEPGEEPPVKATVETQTETTQEAVPPPKPRGDWPRAPPTDSAMFPAEIRLGRDASEQVEEEVIVVAPQPQAPAEGPTALPLVSQLVRELMQLSAT